MTITQFNKQNELKNKQFAKMTKSQKRIKIAKDVLKQLTAKRIVARNATYYCPTNSQTPNLFKYSWEVPTKKSLAQADRQLCDFLPKIKNCNVCALGAMFLAGVENKDVLTVGEFRNATKVNGMQQPMHEYLGDIFSKRQLLTIENAFERHWYYNEPEKTMRRIMKNIIRNNGVFKLNDKEDDVMSRRAKDWMDEDEHIV